MTADSAGTQASSSASPAAETPPRFTSPGVVCLTTDWYAEEERQTENRLAREIVRQGVLLAAREQLGLATRDETLGEPFPEIESNQSAAWRPLELLFDVKVTGEWSAKLRQEGSAEDESLWNHEGKFEYGARTFYAQLASFMADEGDAIAKRLRSAKYSGEVKPVNQEGGPPEDIEQLLLEMNFVSQYAAVRAAHLAVAEEGASASWTAVLVRGYANLAALTDHLWSTHQSAFAARSLLYAERMMQLDGASVVAKWNRAYARAVIGMHGAAIDQLDEIESDESGDSLPQWAQVLSPFVRYQHEQLAIISDNNSELGELVGLLQWNLYNSYRHGRWIYEQGQIAMNECPEAYGVYSLMATWPALKIERLGTHAAMYVFPQRLPRRVSQLEDLPANAHRAASPLEDKYADFRSQQTDAQMRQRPMRIARALEKATSKAKEPRVCSWAILAQLIAEEQFVQVASLLDVSRNAVEHSKASLVESVMPLVEGHRYANYIRSFKAGPQEHELKSALLQELRVLDPRGNMKEMLYVLWRNKSTAAKGARLCWRAFRSGDHALPPMIEAMYKLDRSMSSYMKIDHWRALAQEFESVSPHSPTARRMKWEYKEDLEAKDLAAWEQEIGEDPVGWLSVANRYYQSNDVPAATRCYKRSVEISPSFAATKGLANCYYYSGQEELWQPTLETYLELEDLSLTHAQIHQMIAQEKIRTRDWKAAEPHAIAAAQTYSAWGLLLASRVYEGLRDWDKSEYFVAETSQNYPSGSAGTDWYFWTRRIGRGDRESAAKIAEGSIAIAARRTTLDDAQRVFLYRLLEGEFETAIAGMDAQIALCPDSENKWNQAWRLLHYIIAALHQDDKLQRDQFLDRLRTIVETEILPDWEESRPMYATLYRAIEGEEIEPEELDAYEEVVATISEAFICNYRYFMGAALALNGGSDAADRLLRLATFGGPFENYCATLAGAMLVDRLGPDRGGYPDELDEGAAESDDQEAELDDNTREAVLSKIDFEYQSR